MADSFGFCFGNKVISLFCSWEQCPIPGVVDMWDRQILWRPHLPTIPQGDSPPWISIIHGAKDSVKNPKNGSVSHRFRKFDAPIFVCPSTVCWHWCHKPSEITIKKSLTIPYSTRFVLELEFGRTSCMILFKSMNICSYKFMLDCISTPIATSCNKRDKTERQEDHLGAIVNPFVAMYSQRQPQYIGYPRPWNHRRRGLHGLPATGVPEKHPKSVGQLKSGWVWGSFPASWELLLKVCSYVIKILDIDIHVLYITRNCRHTKYEE